MLRKGIILAFLIFFIVKNLLSGFQFIPEWGKDMRNDNRIIQNPVDITSEAAGGGLLTAFRAFPAYTAKRDCPHPASE